MTLPKTCGAGRNWDWYPVTTQEPTGISLEDNSSHSSACWCWTLGYSAFMTADQDGDEGCSQLTVTDTDVIKTLQTFVLLETDFIESIVVPP